MPESAPSSSALMVSREIAGIYKRWFGRGPRWVRTVVGRDRVVCLLDGVLTTAERTLHAQGHADVVAAQRLELHASLRPFKIAVVQSALQTPVISAMVAVDPVEDLSTEIFVLSDPGYAGRARSAA